MSANGSMRVSLWLLAVVACLSGCAHRARSGLSGPHLGYARPQPQPAGQAIVKVWVPAALEQVVGAWRSNASPEAAAHAQPWLAWLEADGQAEAWPAGWASHEEGLLAEVNRRRASGAWCGERWRPPAPPLYGQPRLRQAARAHSRDMATRQFFGHVSPEGRGPVERVNDAGWPARGYLGELVATGGSAFHTVSLWMGSADHCRSLMHPRFRYAGLGHAMGRPTVGAVRMSTAVISE